MQPHVHPQAMVDLFAELAKPRLMELLKLKSAQHIYDPEPARAPAKFLHEGREIPLGKLIQTSQPYKNIERFVSDERVMAYIVDPGLVPIVKSILLDVRGRRLLVSRRVAPAAADKGGVVAHADGFGMRIVLHVDPLSQEAQVIWECLYGVD
jgi:hypothetical protein